MVADRKRLRNVIDGNFPQFIAVIGECFLTSLTLSASSSEGGLG
jgi:hypothetical protein